MSGLLKPWSGGRALTGRGGPGVNNGGGNGKGGGGKGGGNSGGGSGGGANPFGTVLLLLSGTTAGFVDSSTFHRTITNVGAAFNSTSTLFGNPTYALTKNTFGVTADDTFMNTSILANEFCQEFWINQTDVSASGSLSQFGPFSMPDQVVSPGPGQIDFGIGNIGGSSYTVSVPSFTYGVWHHMAFVRDNRNVDNVSGNLKAYLDGVLVGTSIAFNKTASVAAVGGLGKLLGYFNIGPTARIIEWRLTGGYPVYLANFTPPSAPFPIP